MENFEQKRRDFLITVGGLGISQVLMQGIVAGRRPRGKELCWVRARANI